LKIGLLHKDMPSAVCVYVGVRVCVCVYVSRVSECQRSG